MVKRSPEAESTLVELSLLDQRIRDRKMNGMLEARKALDQELLDLNVQKGLLAHKLIALGMPKTRIRMEGLHTKDSNTLTALLASTQNTEDIKREAREIVESQTRFRWLNDTDIRVNWRGVREVLPSIYDERKINHQQYDADKGRVLSRSEISDDLVGTIRYENGRYIYLDDEAKTPAHPEIVKYEPSKPYAPGPLVSAMQDPAFIAAVDEWRSR